MTAETTTSDRIADRVQHHADAILRAAGSSALKHYMEGTRRAILAAMLDAYEEAYRAGAGETMRQIAGAQGHPGDEM